MRSHRGGRFTNVYSNNLFLDILTHQTFLPINSNAQTSQRHSLSGNSNLRNTDYIYPAAQVNQGIINDRPEGFLLIIFHAVPVTLDTYVDKDESATTSSSSSSSPPVTRASDTLSEATSADVHGDLDHPGQGMSSKELRHDGQPGRKWHEEGTVQFDQEGGRGDGSRKLDGASERRFVAAESDLSHQALRAIF
ncbi:hypothetical protein DFH29DRAFT_848490 [Suillus ampliporus]|nr:hypothetical protein DFH29DRAFT_848490 [Suillus ampliporus]